MANESSAISILLHHPHLYQAAVKQPAGGVLLVILLVGISIAELFARTWADNEVPK